MAKGAKERQAKHSNTRLKTKPAADKEEARQNKAVPKEASVADVYQLVIFLAGELLP
jgi:hypothetical protein